MNPLSDNNVTEVYQENLIKEEVSLGNDFKASNVKQENQIKEECPSDRLSPFNVKFEGGIVKAEYFEDAEVFKLETVKEEGEEVFKLEAVKKEETKDEMQARAKKEKN